MAVKRKGVVHTLESLLAAIIFLVLIITLSQQVDVGGEIGPDITLRERNALETMDLSGDLRPPAVNGSIDILRDRLDSHLGTLNVEVSVLQVNTTQDTFRFSDTRTESFTVNSSSVERQVLQLWFEDAIAPNVSINRQIKTTFSQAESITSQSDFNQGQFERTSADRDDNSGDLGLGYRNGTSSDNLVGYWRLDRSVSGSGGTVIDYSGEGNDGTTINGVATGVQGVFGTNSFDFDGNDDYVEAADIDSDYVTASAWINADNWNTDGLNQIIDKEIDSNKNRAWMLRQSHGEVEFFVRVGGTWYEATDGTLPSTGEWHLLTGTYDGETVKLYIDGVEHGSNSNPSGVLNKNDMSLYLGIASYFDGRFFDGTMDDVRIYNRSLSQSEIEELYFQGMNGKFNGTYTREAVNVPSDESLSQLQVYSDNVTTGPGNSSWLKVSHSSGEQQVVELDAGNDILNNYTLDFTNTGGTADVEVNMTADTPKLTPQIRSFKLFSKKESGTERTYVSNNTGNLVNEYETIDISDVTGDGSNKLEFEVTDQSFLGYSVDIYERYTTGEPPSDSDVISTTYPISGYNVSFAPAEVSVQAWQ